MLTRARGVGWPESINTVRIALAGEALFRATTWLIGSADLRVIGLPGVVAAKQQGRRLVFVGWHAHDFVNLGVFHPIFGAESRGAIMVRDNREGLVLHHFGQRMGIQVASLGTDPNSYRWARGIVAMIKLIKSGNDGMLAVDGPDGPAFQAKPGAALIALRAGAVLVPSAVACRRAIRLRNRWDEHVIPLPRTRIVVSFGPLIDATPPDQPTLPSVEQLQQQIQRGLENGLRHAVTRARER